jgi:hypothetical protein
MDYEKAYDVFITVGKNTYSSVHRLKKTVILLPVKIVLLQYHNVLLGWFKFS